MRTITLYKTRLLRDDKSSSNELSIGISFTASFTMMRQFYLDELSVNNAFGTLG
jgi:hypothetical protein